MLVVIDKDVFTQKQSIQSIKIQSFNQKDSKWAGFGDDFIYDEIAKPLDEPLLKYHRTIPSERMKVFEDWVNVPDAEKEKMKNGNL